MKVIKSLKRRGILLIGTARKVTRQEGGFLNFLRPLMTAGLPSMKSVLTPLAKSILILLGLSAEMSAAVAAIQKNIYGLGTTALIISNEEMEDIMKIVMSLEESGLLIKEIINKPLVKQLKMKQKNKKEDFFNVIRNISFYYIRKCINMEKE